MRGCNKSSLAAYIASGLSVGRLPDGRSTEPTSCLYYALEDDATVLSARLRDFGADLGRVMVLGDGRDDTLDADVYACAQKTGVAPALVVVDVLAQWVAPRSIAHAGHVQPSLVAMRRVAQRHDLAVLLVHHSRREVRKRDDVTSGSALVANFARSVLYCTRFGIDRGVVGQRILTAAKSSYGPEPLPLAFEIAAMPALDGGDATMDLRVTGSMPGHSIESIILEHAAQMRLERQIAT